MKFSWLKTQGKLPGLIVSTQLSINLILLTPFFPLIVFIEEWV
jgi:hypothetical protein